MMLIRCCAAMLLTTLAARAQGPKPPVWEMESSGTTAGLRGVHAVGGGVVWASGEHGTVLRTEDSGYMWQSCAMPPGAEKLDFRGIWAWDANTAVVMSSGPGDQSRLYKTTDGCSHWTLLFTNPDKEGFWDAMAFWPAEERDNRGEEEGMLLGDPVDGAFGQFKLFARGRAVKNQRDEGRGASSQGGESAFAASNSSLLLGKRFRYQQGNSTTLWFATGGASTPRVFRLEVQMMADLLSHSWESSPVPMAGGAASAGIFSLAYRGDKELIAVGGDYAKPEERAGTAAWSTDSGKSWTASSTPPSGYRSAVAWDSNDKIWITVGPNGSDYSADDGKTWQPLEHAASSKPGEWNALSLPWVVGPNGRIAKLNSDALPPRASASRQKSSK